MLELLNASSYALEKYNASAANSETILFVDRWLFCCENGTFVAVYHPNTHILAFIARAGVGVAACLIDDRTNLSALGRLVVRGKFGDKLIVTDWSGSQRALNEFKKHRKVTNNIALSPDIIEHDKAKGVYYGRVLC